MSIELPPYHPFNNPHMQVGASKFRDVYGFESPPVVIKTNKKGRGQVFPDLTSAQTSIIRDRNLREQLTMMLGQMGTDESFIPSTTSVIHADEEGNITYTDIQTLLEDSQPIPRSGLSVNDIATGSLEALRNLFRANLDLHRETGESIDIVGSTGEKAPPYERFFKRLLPIFFSYNIVLNYQGEAKIIDVGIFDINRGNNLKSYLSQRMELIGSHFSITLINLILLLREHGLLKKSVSIAHQPQIK